MSRLIDTLRLMRIVNCVLAMIGVGIGASLTWFTSGYYAPVVAAIATFLVCAAGNTVNDLVDIEADRINRPERVLVRGGLSRKYARNLAVVMNLLALVCAAAVSWQLVAIAALAIGLLLAYNLWLKRRVLIGNILVALLAGLTFLTGGIAVDPVLTFRLPGPLIAAIFAFFFHLVREIVKDVEDMEGDRQAGRRSLPMVIGVSRSLLVALGLFFVLALLTYLPILSGWFGRNYEIITVYLVDLPLLAFLIFVWANPTRRMLAIGSTALKVGMALGLIALVLS